MVRMTIFSYFVTRVQTRLLRWLKLFLIIYIWPTCGPTKVSLLTHAEPFSFQIDGALTFCIYQS